MSDDSEEEILCTRNKSHLKVVESSSEEDEDDDEDGSESDGGSGGLCHGIFHRLLF